MSRQVFWESLAWLLLACMLSTASTSSDLCPCLTADAMVGMMWSEPMPDGYGVGCSAHDQEFGTFGCGSEPFEAWCPNEWCYTDPETCSIDNDPSTLLLGASFSYGTCGFLDRWRGEELRHSMQGETMRVLFLSNSGGWKGNFCSSDDRICSLEASQGPLKDFFLDMGAAAGFDIEQLAEIPSEALQAAAGSDAEDAHDYCPYATSMGFVDVCVSAFSRTAKRVQISPFSPDLYHALFYLVVPISSTSNFELAVRLFKPFSPMLWVLLVFTTITFNIALWLWEKPTAAGNDGDGNEDYVGLTTPSSTAVKTTYLGFLSLGTGAPENHASRPQSKILKVGFAYFILFVTNAYMANLVSILLQGGKPSIGSLDDLIAVGSKICINSNQITPLVSNEPGIEPLIQVVSGRTALLEGIDNGLCGACLASTEIIEVAHAASTHCDKNRVGDPLVTQPYAMPVAQHVASAIDFWASELKAEGKWETRLQHYMPNSESCGAQEEEEEESQSLDPQHLLGAFMVFFGFFFAAVITDVIIRVKHKGEKGKAGGDPHSMKQVEGGAHANVCSSQQVGVEALMAELRQMKALINERMPKHQHGDTGGAVSPRQRPVSTSPTVTSVAGSGKTAASPRQSTRAKSIKSAGDTVLSSVKFKASMQRAQKALQNQGASVRRDIDQKELYRRAVNDGVKSEKEAEIFLKSALTM